jgi:hypothetical protein
LDPVWREALVEEARRRESEAERVGAGSTSASRRRRAVAHGTMAGEGSRSFEKDWVGVW